MQFHTRKECRYGTDSNSTEGLPESGNSVNISAPICPQSEEGTKKSDGSDKSEDFLNIAPPMADEPTGCMNQTASP